MKRLKFEQESKTLDNRCRMYGLLLLSIPNASAALSRTLSYQETLRRMGRARTHVRTPHVAQGQLTPRANTNRLPGVVPTVETWSPWQTAVYVDREVVSLPPFLLSMEKLSFELIDVRALISV